MFYYSHVIQFYKIQLIQEDPTTARKHKIDTQKALGEIQKLFKLTMNEDLDLFFFLVTKEYGINLQNCILMNTTMQRSLLFRGVHGDKSTQHLPCQVQGCSQQDTEVKYNQGRVENLELSGKYFAQALKLFNRNMKALFGLKCTQITLLLIPTQEQNGEE